MQIRSLASLSPPQHEEAAAILLEAMAHIPSAWADLPAARAEVSSFLVGNERVAIATLENNRLLGWIGAIGSHSEAWELHPLAVRPEHQRRGCGTLLVRTLEEQARAAGVKTIWLGTDDDFGGTNLFGVDLYPDVLGRLQELAPTRGHPFSFYRKLGYAVVGVIPDATGFGRPDILMAKRIG